MVRSEIIIAHPGKHHALHLVAGCIKSGLDVVYITPFYRSGFGSCVAWMPGRIGDKAKGYFNNNIPHNKVISPFVWKLRRLMSILNNDSSFEASFDLFVAHKIQIGQYQARMLVTLQDYMPESVHAAKKRGWKIWSDQISNQSAETTSRIWKHETSLGLIERKQHNEKNNDAIIAMSDVITLPSSYTLEGIKSRVLTTTKLVNIPYGASAEKFTGEKEANDKEIVVLARANSVRKGGHILLKELHKCANKLLQISAPKKIKIVILGDLEPSLKSLLDKFTYPSNFEILFGTIPHENVQILYRKASLFIMPSLSESMSLACLEAMHAGLPLIITKYCGIDGFEHGRMGYQINDLQDSLSNVLINVFENKELWSEWGSNCQNFAKNLTWEVYEKRISDLAKELIC